MALKKFRLYFGTMFWGSILLLVLLSPSLFPGNDWILSLKGVSGYLQSNRQHVAVQFPYPLYIKKGDPIYWITEENEMQRVGQISVGENANTITWAATDATEAVFFGDAPTITEDYFLVLHETPPSFEWAFDKLLPPAKRAEIIVELKETFQQIQFRHGEHVIPVVYETMREAVSVLQEDLRKAFLDRREAIAKIAARYQDGFVEKQLFPLIKNEIFPIVESRAKPVLNSVGNKIWQRASLWRFGWRLAYDNLPLTGSNLLQQEWSRFVANEAMPVIESYSDEFYQLSKDILQEIAGNSAVKQAGKDAMKQLLDDREILDLLSATLREVLVDNDRLKVVVKKSLENAEIQSMITEASDRFEDKLREIGDRIFGTFEDGITREFAGVLRKEILRRDQRWFVLKYRGPSRGGLQSPIPAQKIEGVFEDVYDRRPDFVRSRQLP